MKRNKLIKVIAITMCLAMTIAGCGGKSATAEQPTAPSTDEERPADEPAEDSSFSLKPSPDKYTQYVGKYVGMNAASVGYTSLGEDRMLEIGAGYLQITYVTADGTYVGVDDEENLKNYVITAQAIEPNT